MTGFTILYSFIILIVFNLNVFPQHYPDSNVDKSLIRGINDLVLQNYDSASEHFFNLDHEFEKLPFGKLYLAALHIVKSNDLFQPVNNDYLDSLFDEIESLCELELEKNNDDFWANYCLALSLGFKSYGQALHNEYFSAFSNGYESLLIFDKCGQIKPNCNDSRVAIGTYLYWKSSMASLINWVPFVEDNREEGLSLLTDAMNDFSYNKYLAINSLIWIYIEEKKFDNAIELCVEALKKFPTSRTFLWSLARAYEEMHIPKAINVYLKIIESIEKKSLGYNEIKIVASHKIIQLYKRVENFAEAQKIKNKIKDIYTGYKSQNEEVNLRLEYILK